VLSKYLDSTGETERKLYAIKALYDFFGSVDATTLNSTHIRDYETHRGVSEATLNKEKQILRSALRMAHIEPEIVWKITKPQGRVRWITEEEAERLIEGVDDKAPYLKDIIRIALNTGMRKGEILNLKNEQIHLGQGIIILRPHEQKNGRISSIPINNTVRVILDKYTGIEGRLFPYGDIKRSFSTACRNAGIEDFHFHDLRHTFASWLIQKGVKIEVVKELLRHTEISMTMRYAHLSPDATREAMRVLDER